MTNITNKKCIVLLSGGPDSATAAYWAKKEGYTMKGLVFDLGQKPAKNEIMSAHKVAKSLGMDVDVVDLSTLRNLFVKKPKEEYVPLMHGTKPTIPFGSSLILSPSACLALKSDMNSIVWGIHSDDSTKSYEYRNEAIESFSETVRITTQMEFNIVTPFLKIPKSEVIKLGAELRVPFELTWSCENSDELHCGSCNGCKARKRSFEMAGVIDKTSYNKLSIGLV